jgi:inhibitor of KinA sporulation pathway (predicted exonuclease)
MNALVSMLAALSGPLVVFDLEFTAWEGSHTTGWSRPGEFREIVQIGAVRLAPDLGELACFNRLVRPVRNPRLSDYFIALTGITQQRLDAGGESYPVVLEAFAAFVGADSVAVLSNGSDGAVVVENCRMAAVPCPIPAGRFVNVRRPLAEALGLDPAVADSSNLPRLIGLALDHRAHDALDDARGIAAALRHVAGRGATPDMR